MNTTDEAGSIDPAASETGDGADSDELLVARARARDGAAFELLMRRHNQRIYRVVRSVLRDSDEIEDVIQQAYVQAFLHLDQFDGNARWSTWVCRIAINEALARLRQRGRFVSIEAMSEDGMANLPKVSTDDPERATAGREFGQMVEQAIDQLPDIYRSVLIMREVEGMKSTYEFGNERCDRVVAAVLARLQIGV
jgi:RNA polymerase sigma-70 factor (ECF subfamily)